MTIDIVIAKLDAFTPREESENVHQLYEYLSPLAAVCPTARLPAAPAMLRLLERYPEAELGSPGPVVHELEAIPGYQSLLIESIQRQPTSLTIWMANRILNSELSPEDRSLWLAILTGVHQHPRASEETKQGAADFLEYQGS